MVYLQYNILGKNKKIKIDEIDEENENVVKRDEKHYEFHVGNNEQKIFKKLLKILNLWNEFTEQNEIDYWACGGTLLGAVRHSGFIPWDNDLDVCVMLSDLKKIKKRLDGQDTLTYYECEIGLRVYIKGGIHDNDNSKYDNNSEIEFPFLDVFIHDYYNRDTIKYCGFLSKEGAPTWFINNLFPNEHIYKNELYPLKRIAFENTTISVPNNEIDLLYRIFSDKCLTSCKISNAVLVHESFLNKKQFMVSRYKFLQQMHSIDEVNPVKINKDYTLIGQQYKIINKFTKGHALLDSFFKKVKR
jgi:phosphorylcholine metabolism protein LicD